jgi:hypothetical protein
MQQVSQDSYKIGIIAAIDNKDEEAFLKLISENHEKINSSINKAYL